MHMHTERVCVCVLYCWSSSAHHLNLVNLDAKLSLSSRAVLPSWTQAPPWTRDMFTESQSVVSLRLNLKILSQEVISASSCSTNTKILKAAMSIEEKTWSVCLPALVSRCLVNYRKGSCITCIRNFSLQTLLFGRRAADVLEAQPCQTCNTYWRQTLNLGSAPSWPLCRSMWRRENVWVSKQCWLYAPAALKKKNWC